MIFCRIEWCLATRVVVCSIELRHGTSAYADLAMSRIDVRVRPAILCAVNTLLPVAYTSRPRADPSAVLGQTVTH